MLQSKDTDCKLDKMSRPIMCCIQETHLTCKNTYSLKIKGWRKTYQANGEKKKRRSCDPSL